MRRDFDHAHPRGTTPDDPLKTARRSRARRHVPGAIALLALGLCLPAVGLADTFYVDGANPGASDANPGTEAQPFRTIQAALDLQALPGNTIYVKPAIYRELVNLPRSGATNNPIIIEGLGTGVIVDGSDNFGTAAQWTPVSGDVYLAASVTWSPLQVFVNGQRLTPSVDAPAFMAANTFRWISGAGLYVNAGGGNPGLQQTLVGRRANGFRLSTKVWVVIRNFTVTRFEDRGIYLSSGSDSSTVYGNTVTFGAKYGIAVTNSDGVTVDGNVVGDHLDHGIYLGSATHCLVRRNESYRNARPNQRAANGIYLTTSTNNRMEGNRLHDNQDTGLHFQDSSNNLSIQNRSYNNGDHGYDHLGTSGVVHINDTAYGNFKDGFSIEGNSPGNTIYNCIAINNGLTTNEFDLWVDPASSVNFTGDYNVFWNSTSQVPVKYVATQYSTVAAYSSVSGQDVHSLQVNPMFADPANGDYHLLGGSPAIDCANSSVPNWPVTDAEGTTRRDDPSTTNTGVGPVTYGDRGALEFIPPGGSGDQAPVILAPVTANGAESGIVTVNVTASDPDGQLINSLTASLTGLPAGSNAVFTTNATQTAGTLTWTPTFADGRAAPYVVSFTASNALSATASTSITVANVDRPPVVTTQHQKAGSENSPITINVTAVDPDLDAITSLTADVSALPAGNNAVFTPNANKNAGTFIWTPTFADSGGPWRVVFVGSNALTGRDTSLITVANVDRAPVVTAPATQTTAENSTLTFSITAVDPDGDPISSLTASGLPAGATFTADPGKASGTFAWTPTFNDGGGPYNVSFSATNVLVGTSVTAVTVTNVDRPPVVTAPAQAAATEGQPLSVAVTATDPDGQTILSLTATGLPPGATFTPNGSRTAGVLDWTPGFDAAPGPDTVRFVATNSLSGSAATAIVIANVDRAPVVTAATSVMASVGQQLVLTISAADPDGEAIASLTANLASLPAGDASFTPNPSNTGGTLRWTPQAADAAGGPYSVTFTAQNARTGTASTTIAVDRPPVVIAPATANATENALLTFTVTASDPDGQPITALTASGLPAGATFVPDGTNTSGTFMWTPPFSAAPGPYAITFTAQNGVPGSATTSVSVANVDRAPVVTAPATAQISDGSLVTVAVTAADPDGDVITALTADVSAIPGGNKPTFVPNGTNTAGMLTWTPQAGQSAAGPYTITFTAQNALGGTATTQLTGDRSPIVTAPASQPATENTPVTFTVTVVDPDGQAIKSLAATGLPAGATFTPDGTNTSGTFAWTPGFTAAPGPYLVTFTASNTRSGSATTSIPVTNVDRAPVVVAPASRTFAVGAPSSFTVMAADSDGDAIASLTASGLPPGATFTAPGAHTTGTFTWTPALADAPGPYTITFTAANAASGSASTTVTVDRPPVVTAPPTQSVNENAPLSFGVTAADPDGQPIGSLVATGLPPGATFTPNGANTAGTFQWTPGFDAAPGPYVVTFTAANGTSGSAGTSIAVHNVDRAPQLLVAGAVSINESQPLSLVVNVADPDGDAVNSLTADLSALPVGNNAQFTVNASRTQGTLTWTPTPNDGRAAPYVVSFTASNALPATSSTSITVVDQISNLCPNPSFESGTTNWNAYGGGTFTRVAGGQEGAFALQVKGPAGTATFGANDSPNFISNATGGTRYRYTAWVRSVSNTGQARLRIREYTPTGVQAGTAMSAPLTLSPAWDVLTLDYVAAGSGNTLDFQVLDNIPVASAETFLLDNVTVFVATSSSPPVVTAPATVTASENAPLTVTVTAADPDGEPINTLTANLSSLPAGNNAVFTTNGSHTVGTLTWTPTFSDAPGSYAVMFTAANTQSSSTGTTITVQNVDRAPVVTAPGARAGVVGQPISIAVTAADPDGDAIGTFTASGLPATATFTPGGGNTSGTFQWTPAAADTGTRTVTFTAQNALPGSASTVITIGTSDHPPVVVAPASKTVAENAPLSFSVTASDPDGQPIASLTATGLPPGATFSDDATHTTGTFGWTPGFTAAPGPYNVTFTAANALSGSAATSITVTNVDRAPVPVAAATVHAIAGQPVSVGVTASDPDGDAIASLTAALGNLPAGNNAVFTPGAANATGTLTWTPAAADVRAAAYNVTFTATNGLSGTATTGIIVDSGVPTNLCSNPGFETNLTGWGPNGGSVVSRVAGGQTGGFACQVTGPASTVQFGLNDSPNIMPNTAAGRRYRYTVSVRSASNTGLIRLRFREYTSSGAQVGATVQSAGITLTSAWQTTTMDYVAVGSGNTLDFQVFDSPLVAGETYLVDDVSVTAVSGLVAAGEEGVLPAGTDGRSRAPDSSSAIFEARGTAARLSLAVVPNPARANATLWLSLPVESPVRIDVFDASGRLVRALVDDPRISPGVHEFAFDRRDNAGLILPAGSYFYRVRTVHGNVTGRFAIVN